MRKRTVLAIALSLVVFLLAAALSTQMLVPPDAQARFPKDRQQATLAAEVDVANINQGRGVITLLVPVKVDDYLAKQLVPVIVTPDTWVRVSGTSAYVPARLLPTRDSEVLALAKYLTGRNALRVVVERRGSRLSVLKAEPCTAKEARANAHKVDSVGPVDLDSSVELTGLINGWSESGSDNIGVDFNTPVSVEGFPSWLQLRAQLSPDVALSLDGRAVDMNSNAAADFGLEPSDVLGKIMENQVVALFEPRGSRLRITQLKGTREEYFGPFPGDTGALEEELERDSPAQRDEYRLHPGDEYLMMNGLEFTVPRSWEGTFTQPPGDSESPEYVVLHAPGRTEHPSSVMLYSAGSVPLELPGPANEFETVLKLESMRVLMGKQDFPKAPMRLFVAETSIPGKRKGAVYFGGSSKDPIGSVREIWQLLKMQGTSVETTSK